MCLSSSACCFWKISFPKLLFAECFGSISICKMYIVVNFGFIHEFVHISSDNSEVTLPEIAAVNSCTPESLFNSFFDCFKPI